MKKTSLKQLSIAISSLMAMIITTTPNVWASDTEIYQAPKEGSTTLMLMLDISGSMGLGHSMRDDYNIKAGDSPQYGNAQDARNSYCQLGIGLRNWRAIMSDGTAARYVGNNVWIAQNPVVSARDSYAREFCEIPLNGPPNQLNYINTTAQNSWATDQERGCPTVDTNNDGVADVRRCYSRITRVKDAIFDLLKGNPAKGIAPLADDKAIGLSTISIRVSQTALDPEITGPNQWGPQGAIRVPARRLDTVIGGRTQREILLEAVARLELGGSTPTAQSYAETVAYMMGQNPSAHGESGYRFSSASTKIANGSRYETPATLDNQQNKECSGQGVYILTDGEPNNSRWPVNIMRLALGLTQGNPSYQCNFYDGLTNPEGNQSHRIWNCMYSFAETLNDPTKTPLGLRVKTAVVGFGRNYFDVPKYDKTKTKDENLALIKTNNEASRAARLGIRGEGGWYPGSSPQDVVNSVNDFIETLVTDIPDVVTGQPAIPVDPLSPLVLMKQGFYGTFIPKVGANQTFWSGDMNKYDVKKNMLYGSNDQALFKSNGLVSGTAIGYWGDGMVSKLPLRLSSDNTTTLRKVFTNETTGANQALTPVTVDALYDGTSKLGADTTNRNAWLNLLGYNIPLLDNSSTPVKPSTPVERINLDGQPELRQAGALLHSTPIILTQSNQPERKDYVLYGSTQGILHVVDSKNGEEKIAFVPKEMMTSQKDSFQHTNNALGTMKYGIDGQWTAYTQYIPDGNGGFTVNDTSTPAATSTNIIGKGVQWVYGGLRMGGRSYYALDLSDIDKPKLKFHINPDGAVAGSPLSYMGQSWSKPSLGFVKWKGSHRLVMFVGGGYDNGYEGRTYDQTNGVGAGVYMFDAHDGTLLWWGSSHATTSTSTSQDATEHSALKYSVVSDISTFDRNNDGLIDHLMFGDLGGQVFRVDLDNDHAASDGLVTRIVRLYNGHQAGGLSPRFYEAPSFSAHSGIGASGQFGIISIASGNRSSPLASVVKEKDGTEKIESAKDALFVLYDHDILKKGTVKKGAQLIVTDAATDKLVENDKARMTSGNTDQQIKTVDGTGHKQGWKYYLSTTAGELKGYSSPRVVDNFLFLTTYTPQGGTTIQNSCNAGILGESFQEVFCLPGGVCDTVNGKDQRAVLNITSIEQNTGNGSARRIKLSIGITQPSVGHVSDTTPNKYGIVSPQSIDCTKPGNQNDLKCITEVARITNKPVRWYEDNPKTN